MVLPGVIKVEAQVPKVNLIKSKLDSSGLHVGASSAQIFSVRMLAR